jgi:enterochelin esterase-like enzyme
LSWAAELWGLALNRDRTVVAGMSAGGKTAGFAALRAPEHFGRVLAQSAAIAFPSAVLDLPPRWLLDEYVARAPHETMFALDVGLLGTDLPGDFPSLLEANREWHRGLVDRGCAVRYVEIPTGHDEWAFGEAFAESLAWLLGGQRERSG